MTEKKDGVEKVEMVETVTKVTKVTNSTLPTKSTLIIKGLPTEDYGKFKYFSNLFGMKYHEFFKLLLADFCEHNPELEAKLTHVTVKLDMEYKEPPKTIIIKNQEAEMWMKSTKEMREAGTLSDKGLKFRLERLRELVIKDRNMPEVQRQEIADFVASCNQEDANGSC